MGVATTFEERLARAPTGMESAYREMFAEDVNIDAERAKLEERVGVVAARMTMRFPFIAAVFMKMERKFPEFGTAATDGVNVYFSVRFCRLLTDNELLFIALHEAMHAILMHSWRREGRDPAIFNIACDAVINPEIVRMGITKIRKAIGEGVFIDWVKQDMDAEEVYTRLARQASQQQQQQAQQGQGDGDGDQNDDSSAQGQRGQSTSDGDHCRTGGGGWDDEGDLGDAPDKSTEADMQATIMTAAKMAKACGDGSMLVERVLNGGLEPEVPWHETLRHLMTAANRDDYTFGRVNRRFISSGIYLPALYSEGMGGLVVGFDTSGSMGQDEADRCATEITAIFEDCNPDWVKVIYCDSRVQKVEHFERGDDIKLHVYRGGGTKFAPVFDHVEDDLIAEGERVAALIYFTDLYGSLDLDVPEYPVLWAVTSNARDVPFGDVVKVNV